MSERVRNAMSSGCCVISDKNLELCKYYAHEKSIIFLDENNNDLVQALNYNQSIVHEIAMNGYSITTNMCTKDKYIKFILESIQ